MRTPLAADFDDVEEAFQESRLSVQPHRKRGRSCHRSFVQLLVHVLHVLIALVVASAFAFVPAVSDHVASAFLMLLTATLAVGPVLGASVVAAYDLVLYAVVMVVATSVGVIVPHNQAPLVAFIIVVGVVALHFADLRPGTQKLASALWLLILLGSHLGPPLSPWQLFINAAKVLTGLALGLAAALVGSLCLPVTATSVANRAFVGAAASLAHLIRMLGDEYTHAGSVNGRNHESSNALRNRIAPSLPKLVSGSDVMMHQLDEQLDRVTQHHSASFEERVAAFSKRLSDSIALGLSVTPVVQVEHPLRDVRAYATYFQRFRDMTTHFNAAASTIVNMELASTQPTALDDYPILFRMETKESFARVCNCAADLLEAVSVLPVLPDGAGAARVRECQDQLKVAMEAVRKRVHATRMALLDRLDLKNNLGVVGPSLDFCSTYWCLLEAWFFAEGLLDASLDGTLVEWMPRSSAHVQQTASWWVLSWSPAISKADPSDNYVRSPALGARLLSALTIGMAVGISLLFSLLPTLTAVFTRGVWASLTCIFVYNTNSGSTLRAARDRMLGIFLGSSYSFIVLLILRDPQAAVVGALSPYGVTGFAAAWVVFLFLFIDNPALIGSGLYACILYLYSSPIESAQSSFVVENFLMTFVGAGIVSLLSSVWFFFNSPRYLFIDSLVAASTLSSEIISGAIDRVTAVEADESVASIPQPAPSYRGTLFAPQLAQLQRLCASMTQNLADVAVEPTLWRLPVDQAAAAAVVRRLEGLGKLMMWLASAAAPLATDETHQVGLLRTSVLPIFIATRWLIAETLSEVPSLLAAVRDPSIALPFNWRDVEARGRSSLLRNCILASREIWSSETDLTSVSSRPFISYFAFCLLLERIADETTLLWRDVFSYVSTARQASLRFDLK